MFHIRLKHSTGRQPRLHTVYSCNPVSHGPQRRFHIVHGPIDDAVVSCVLRGPFFSVLPNAFDIFVQTVLNGLQKLFMDHIPNLIHTNLWQFCAFIGIYGGTLIIRKPCLYGMSHRQFQMLLYQRLYDAIQLWPFQNGCSNFFRFHTVSLIHILFLYEVRSRFRYLITDAAFLIFLFVVLCISFLCHTLGVGIFPHGTAFLRHLCKGRCRDHGDHQA